MRSSDWSSDVCSSDLEQPEYRYSWGRQNWFDHAAAEHKAVREGVGLFDLTSFAKFRVEGRDAEAVLQRISANDVAVAPGRIVSTQWLHDRGGIEADLRSEERRVGTECVSPCRSRWSQYHSKNKKHNTNRDT